MSEILENSLSQADSNLSSNNKQPAPVTQIVDIDLDAIQNFLNKYQLNFQLQEDNQAINGSFWGDSEAGLIDNKVYARRDTPIHSLLHETCHFICMDENRRQTLDTNAQGDYDEENAVCYLQILLANEIPDFSSKRMMQDMDSWGYTFRLGSAKAWFEEDAEDALAWLKEKNLLDVNNQPNYSLRQK